jgi:glycerophosphoryl diester phosphodiesterase
VQSFDAQALRDVTRARPDLARTFLIEADAERWLSADGLRTVATFATWIGPNKLLLDGHPDIVRRAHEAGLTVTPYTFTTRAPGRIADVVEEMRYYLDGLGVDALFTDNPDRFPRQRQQPASR